MAEAIAQPDSMHIEGDDEPLLSVDVPLGDVVDKEDNTFRTENESKTDYERRNIIERNITGVHTRVELLGVKHGLLDENDEGTLLVFRFRFDPQTNLRRVIRAVVNIEFFASDEADDPPVVEAIAPEGRFTVMPTTDHVSTTRGGDLSLGASGIPLATANATVKLEKTTTRDISDATTVTGSINLGRGRNKGASTAAAWNLLENRARKSGVPDSLKVAILLRRADGGRFNAKVTMENECDFITGLQWNLRKVLGRVPLDDPVLFNPRFTGKGKSNRLCLSTQDLLSVKLNELCEVKMAVEAKFAHVGQS